MSLFDQGLIAYLTVGAFVASLFHIGTLSLRKTNETEPVKPDVFLYAAITFGWALLPFTTTVKRDDE